VARGEEERCGGAGVVVELVMMMLREAEDDAAGRETIDGDMSH
jgi:hypothetical protein